MTILENISLKPYNTFGIDVNAKYFVSVNSVEALKSVLALPEHTNYFIISGGSNILLTKDVNHLVIHLNIKGIHTVTKTETTTLVTAFAGENWHEFVLWTLNQNLAGIENLALIPGNVGTSPIQNIGAYGVELKDTFVECRALHIETQQIETFTNADCNFGYRTSIFKEKLKGQYIILEVTFKLYNKDYNLKTDYGAIKEQLQSMQIVNPTIQDVSNAVITIRESKLPNPKQIGNSGSFFKNPIISKHKFNNLKLNFPEMPSYKLSADTVKIPAGWLIEHAGFKGKRFDNYGVHQDQALVLVNYGGAKGTDIYNLSNLIQLTIKRLYDIDLEAEVNII